MNVPSPREINGPRPAHLKIHKDSQLIHKQSSSSSSSTTHHRHHPVIIYTDSPKIIHTQVRDFMALVQKLTGLPPSTDDNDVDDSSATTTNNNNNNPPPALSNIPCKDADTMHAANDVSSSSSSSENRSIAGEVAHHVGCSSLPSATATVTRGTLLPDPSGEKSGGIFARTPLPPPEATGENSGGSWGRAPL